MVRMGELNPGLRTVLDPSVYRQFTVTGGSDSHNLVHECLTMASMKWKIWPRQYGKTHQLREWWLEDPEHRVILCESDAVAQYHGRVLVERLYELDMATPISEHRKLVHYRIMSYKTWLNGTRVHPHKAKFQVAVDGLDAILPDLIKANVVYAAGVGTNDVPDPAHASEVEHNNQRFREMYGVDWDA